MRVLLTTTGLALILAAGPITSNVTAQEGVVESQQENQWLASSLMDQEVHGENDESIGQISDLLVDENGEIAAVVVGVGEYLGIGERDVALEFDELESDREGDRMQFSTEMTRSELEEAPEFERQAGLGTDSQTGSGSPSGTEPGAQPGGTTTPGESKESDSPGTPGQSQ